MKRSKPGRPQAGRNRVERDSILRIALEILDREGPQGLTMRSLAKELRVTPMALYHHVGNRTELLRALADEVYSDVPTVIFDSSHTPNRKELRSKIEHLLDAYYLTVLRHPNLSLSLLATPEAFSRETQRITDNLFDLLRATQAPPAECRVWRDVLIDYTHGSSIATATFLLGIPHSSKSQAKRIAAFKTARRHYLQGLALILESQKQF